jgi:ribonucleoside-diphosphate reductase alpha chain
MENLDLIELSENALKQFRDLYSFQGETVEETFTRVAKEFSKNDEDFEFAYNLLAQNIWRPNTPVFLNAGTEHKVFSACYTVSLEDSMSSIYDIANVARKIFQYGAGVGIPIGNLREGGAYIFEGRGDVPPEGKSSGPITFMRLFDAVGETTKSGGRVRRAAILCAMPVWHPDIMDFISCKETDGRLSNMNISVAVTDKFMQTLEDKIPFPLHTPYDGSKIGEIDPQELWDKIAEMAHKSADPGVLFIDTVNKWNPLVAKYLVETTNPCGEQPLIGYNSCNLSAINISKFVVEGLDKNLYFDFDNLYRVTYGVTELMDNLIDIMEFPDERYKVNTRHFRPMGIGPMGLADAMFMLDYRYDGPEGRKFASDVMKTLTTASIEWSADLHGGNFGSGGTHGLPVYWDFKDDMERIAESLTDNNEKVMEKVRKNGLRNCQHTTCQPTGTTALSCDCSYGIEPSFGLVFQKNYIDGATAIMGNQIFEERFSKESWYTDDLLERVFKNGGSLKGIRGIPKEVREVFVTAHDIKYKDRIDMQAELQKHCSTAISSTVNLPKEITKEEISDLYKYAYEKGLKGVTIYRDGSKRNQPVTFTEEDDGAFSRPAKLSSDTYVVETGNGKMYVTISDYKGKPLELFINISKSGQILNTFSEALGRLISIAFQNGVPVEEVVKTLVGINSDKNVWYRFEESDKKPTHILSIPDGVAKLLERYYSGQQYKGELSGEICDKCGRTMVAMEGCFNCSCGHSKCS